MAITRNDATLFENEDWWVIDSGIEHKRTAYFISRDEIASRRTDGLWSWPMHLAEKSWCSLPSFIEAFSSAVVAYGVPVDASLAETFRLARCDEPEVYGQAGENTLAAAAEILRREDRIPIFRKLGRAPHEVALVA